MCRNSKNNQNQKSKVLGNHIITNTNNRNMSQVSYLGSNITDSDVLLGRGNGVANHVGNQRFRNIINDFREIYLSSARAKKVDVAKKVIKQIQQLNPPGRFMEHRGSGCEFAEVGIKRAIEKVCQALREKQSSSRRRRQRAESRSATRRAIQPKNKDSTAVKVPKAVSRSSKYQQKKLPELAPVTLRQCLLQANYLANPNSTTAFKASPSSHDKRSLLAMTTTLPYISSRQRHDDVSMLSTSFEKLFHDFSKLAVFENPIKDSNAIHYDDKAPNIDAVDRHNLYRVVSVDEEDVASYGMMPKFEDFCTQEENSEDAFNVAESSGTETDDLSLNNDPLFSYFHEIADKGSCFDYSLKDFSW